jgi:hypothetical protein
MREPPNAVMGSARGRLVGRAALLGCAAALVAATGLASAADPPKPALSRDAAGDVRSPLDITRMSLTRDRDGRLRGSVTMAQPWADAVLLAASGPPGSVCLRLWTTTAPPDQPPTYLVCATVNADGALRGSVLRERPNQLPERVTTAAASRPSTRSLVLRFSQTAVGRPASIAVSAESTRAGCPRVSCIDTAPDAPAAVTLRLRAAKADAARAA